MSVPAQSGKSEVRQLHSEQEKPGCSGYQDIQQESSRRQCSI